MLRYLHVKIFNMQVSTDVVGRARADWAREEPDLDTSPMEVIGRILRVAHLADARIRRVLRREGLDRGGLDVLATLCRSGPPYQLTPTRLAAELVLTTGAMTHRVDALVQAGLVLRVADPADRRSSLVGLTEQGKDVAVRAMAAHMAGEAALLTSLTLADRRALAALLARLLTGIEEEEAT
jgi:DNA-binding MarR family transcriptional regulator